MSSRRKVVIINQPGQRLDKALTQELPEVSRTQLQRLISEGRVTVDGVLVKAASKLQGGERVIIDFPPVQPAEIVAQPLPLDIRYEDRDILVVNKPAGMVVHPSPGHQSGTLVNGILAYCPELEGVGGQRRPGIVHRLDKETSGLIVVAKNDRALQFLQEQFKMRQVRKRYLALVHGLFKRGEILIDAPIGRDPRERKKMAVIRPGTSAASRPAQTRVRALALYTEASLLECWPKTGRTHQIRVHLAFAGHPIVGDQTYGRRRQPFTMDRHFLHAAGLQFRRPSDNSELVLEAELPDDLQDILRRLQPAA
ncbi:MAG: RluA family pseudouridine synthase [Chloroflexota bacterium]|jgi:23S rRNA pseudouridine1911/1915/1917 synthase